MKKRTKFFFWVCYLIGIFLPVTVAVFLDLVKWTGGVMIGAFGLLSSLAIFIAVNEWKVLPSALLSFSLGGFVTIGLVAVGVGFLWALLPLHLLLLILLLSEEGYEGSRYPGGEIAAESAARLMKKKRLNPEDPKDRARFWKDLQSGK